MSMVTGLSGNEIYCLKRKGMEPGELVIGNSVVALGVIGGVRSSLNALVGGEITAITELINEGRHMAYYRMVSEAQRNGGQGITGVSNELMLHGTNIEFLALGSCVHRAEQPEGNAHFFSSSADAQALYCQMDAGFQPRSFVMGNVAYSIGVGGGIMGALRGLGRGEVKEFSEIFNTTRHLALQRIKMEAVQAGANSVVGISTSVMPFAGMQEMLMIGTASTHAALPEWCFQSPITSDLTNEEMWNLANQGYMPMELVLGVSVYSLGLVGNITSMFKSLKRGEIPELTSLIYEAREQALGKIKDEAQRLGADHVVGVKTYVTQLGGTGVIEFMAIGTAVRKMEGMGTETEQLIPQAIIRDQDTYISPSTQGASASLNSTQRTPGMASGFASGNKGQLQGCMALVFGAFWFLVVAGVLLAKLFAR